MLRNSLWWTFAFFIGDILIVHFRVVKLFIEFVVFVLVIIIWRSKLAVIKVHVNGRVVAVGHTYAMMILTFVIISNTVGIWIVNDDTIAWDNQFNLVPFLIHLILDWSFGFRLIKGIELVLVFMRPTPLLRVSRGSLVFHLLLRKWDRKLVPIIMFCEYLIISLGVECNFTRTKLV